MSFHKDLVGADLHIGRTASGAGSPVGVVTPGIVGEFYFDTTASALYVATGLTNADWDPVSGGGGGSPTGPAGGDLTGTYPNPSVVAASETVAGKIEIATQSETDTGTDDLRAITPLKLATNPRLPTQGENDALQGTDGTPSNANRFVTDSDPRNTNARTPTSHASTHQHGGGDEVATATPAANAIPKAGGGGEVAAGWLPTMVGATSGSPGTKGAVPQPVAGDQEKFLQGNGTWKRLRTHPDSSFGTDLYMLGSPLDYYNTGSPQAANEIQYTRVWLEVGQVIAGARTFITSGANGTRQITMALFDQATPTSNSGAPSSRVATTGPTTPANALTGYYSVNFSVAYTVTATGFYWVAIQSDSGAISFAITDSYPADFLPRREETAGSFTMPTTAGTLTNPASAAIFCAAVE